MHLSFNILLLSLGGLQGLLLGILLLRKKAYRSTCLFLLLYLLTLLLQVVMKVVSKMWLMEHLQQPYWLSYDLPFLYGPLMYLFVVRLQHPDRKFHWPDAWHFLPFLYFALYDLSPGQNLPTRFLDWLFVSRQVICALQLISLAGYHLAAGYWLQRQPADREQRRFLMQLTIASWVVTSLLGIVLYVMFRYYPRLSEFRYLFAAATLFIYWISYQAMCRPALFGLAPTVPVSNDLLPAPGTRGNNEMPKYRRSTLKAGEIDAILVRLQQIMTHQRPYLDPELSIDTLAALTGTNRHFLSQVINDRLQKNFYDYLNGYRVAEAQCQLADPRNRHLKIAAIAYDAGFNSLSTFNEVFKKISGQTPSEFRRLAESGFQTQGI